MTRSEWIRFLIPLIIAIIVIIFFPMSKLSGSSVNSRPPSYIFGIVWSFLYLMISISWSRIDFKSCNVRIMDAMFLGMNLLLALWVITYTKVSAKSALYTLLISLGVVGTLIWYLTSHKQILSAGLLQPLFFWCLFALMLNFAEVEKIGASSV